MPKMIRWILRLLDHNHCRTRLAVSAKLCVLRASHVLTHKLENARSVGLAGTGMMMNLEMTMATVRLWMEVMNGVMTRSVAFPMACPPALVLMGGVGSHSTLVEEAWRAMEGARCLRSRPTSRSPLTAEHVGAVPHLLLH